jgi:hypothetical protein
MTIAVLAFLSEQLVTYSEEMARSLSRKIELLSSHGSFLRFDVLCLGLSPNQKKLSILVPSQEMNPVDDGTSEGWYLN